MTFATILSISAMSLLYITLKTRRQLMKKRLKEFNLNSNLSKKVTYQFARNLVQMTRGRDVIFENSDNLKGRIGISIHFGPWELIGSTMTKVGYKFGIITKRHDGEVHSMIRQFRHGFGIETFYTDELLRVNDFLKKGGIIGMMVDGHRIESRLPQAKRLADLFGVELRKGAILPRNGSFYLETDKIDFKEIVTKYPEHYAWFYRSHN